MIKKIKQMNMYRTDRFCSTEKVNSDINAASSVLRCSPVYISVVMALIATSVPVSYARDYFDPTLLRQNGGNVDLSQFEEPGGQAAGKYLVDIWVNGNFYETREVNFIRDSKADVLVPGLTPAQLGDMGVKTDSISKLNGVPADQVLDKPLSDYIEQGFTKFDFSHMRLNVSVPQIDMQPDAASRVNPALWNEGVPAFMLNYSVNGNTTHNENAGNSQNNQGLFASFGSGLNLGAWRLRNNSSYSYNQQRYNQYDSMSDATRKVSQSQSKWQSQQTYLQRDIIPMRSIMTLGETSTGGVAGQVLDGFSYRGVNLASNDNMQPGYMSGFAPMVSGIAKSNATVSIRQNGILVYQTNVAPGPFRISDLNGNGNGGDLDVTITEADGTTHGFRQPYSSLPVMQRTGQLRYELAAGQYYPGHGSYMNTRTPGFGMMTMMYGMPHNVTLYGGGIAAQNYQSMALGTGFSIWGLGAVSLDATHSRSKPNDEDKTLSGESYRARFSKSMLTTGTTIDLTAYRYSTRNYMSFTDVNTSGYRDGDSLPLWMMQRRRSSFEMRLSQTLFDRYSVWLSGHRDNYWGSNRTNTTLSAGFGGSTYGMGWNVNYSVDRIRGDGTWPENRQVSLSLNVPMSLFSSRGALSNSYVSYTMSHDNTGRVSNQVSTGGALLDNSQLSWGVSQSQGNQGQSNSGSASLGYNGSDGQANLGYNYTGSSSRGITYGASGGLLIHPYGITLSNTIGDSAVVVRTPGVAGVSVQGGAVTDHWGNAVITGASSYNRNNVSIDPSTLPEGASLTQNSNAVYPTAGAVMVTTFPVRTGQQLLMNLTYNGKPIPFGAIASLKGDSVTQGAIVGDGGQVYLSGMPEKGVLQVRWGQTPDKGCQAPFDIGAPLQKRKGDGFQPLKTMDMICQ